ncbi:MAG TPA: efflux RND transporter permease subunit [Acidobacteriota bacterium]|nr:efflux RND transporter permease subunit [Acidobacteriota bacterium]
MTLQLAGRMARAFADSKLTPLIIGASILLGAGAVLSLPREEEPQIIVPMIDIFVSMPGADAKEVEERVTSPMEQLLWEIPGVEYIYSTSSPGGALAIVRFEVGFPEEDAIVRLNQKMFANFDLIPPGASPPLIKPRSIDDVPVLALTLASSRYDHFTLRQMAAQLQERIKQIENVSEITLIGGSQREVRVELDPSKLASRRLSAGAVLQRLQAANSRVDSGTLTSAGREVLIETGRFFADSQEVARCVVAVHQGRPVYLSDVAQIEDGPAEASDYVLLGYGPARRFSHRLGDAGHAPGEGAASAGLLPAVTLSIAKRAGTNATDLAETVLQRVEALRATLIPSEVDIVVTRNYGETAKEKSDELLFHMAIAVVSVSLLIWLTLGLRESGTVAIAIPVTLALTLMVFLLFGYTLNRVTLFALIFSIGILVDDAIVVVENIVRHTRLPENRGRPILKVAVEAVDEVGNPTILATFAVIAAILPMAFVRGLMGPYMRPIPVGASAAMLFSLLVAFVVTPWASLRLLRLGRRGGGHGDSHEQEDWSTRLYRRLMDPLIHRPLLRWGFLAGNLLLLLAVCSMFYFKAVRVKMLPFDNKSEFQVVIDMPEGTPLEETAASAMAVGEYLSGVPEVTDYQIYVGESSPYNFNGLVRHYFLRNQPHQADLQVNLAPRDQRSAQSHDIAKRLREGIVSAASPQASVKVAEVPPGPPVLATLVTEVYGPDYARQIELARRIEEIFRQAPGVVDVDTTIESPQPKVEFKVDQEKAALHGISPHDIASTLRLAVDGASAGLLHDPRSEEDVHIRLRLPLQRRTHPQELLDLRMAGPSGLVPLRELVEVHETVRQPSIYHKNLMPVVYVMADMAGQEESPVYAVGDLGGQIAGLSDWAGYEIEQWVTRQPPSQDRLALKWDGEWHITYEVFRDMGLAFAVVLVLIYILVVGWFQSLKTPFIIMAAIPFSLVGILPAHWLMGAFFTATSMIGFIAGAGIVVRNSIILVDFIELRLKQGMPVDQAVVDAGAVRFRPMMLTAAAVVVGASVILFDPIFQGLALSLMAGEVASLLLSRMTVPILYFLGNRG